MKSQTHFVIIDKVTNKKLAKLPLTFSIGKSLENYERAGYLVRWTWGR